MLYPLNLIPFTPPTFFFWSWTSPSSALLINRGQTLKSVYIQARRGGWQNPIFTNSCCHMNYCYQSKKKRIVNTEFFFLSKEFLESVETFFLSFLSLLGSSFDLCIRNVNFFLDLLYSLYHKNIGQSTFCSGLSILYTKTNH